MTENTNSNSNKPTLFAYQVRDGNNGKGYRNRIGAAWPTKNGGFTLQLDCVPLDGRIVCQQPPADSSGGSQ